MKKILFILLLSIIVLSVYSKDDYIDKNDKGEKPKLGTTAIEGQENIKKIKKQKIDFILNWDEAKLWKIPLEEYYIKHAEKSKENGEKPILTKEEFEKEFNNAFSKGLKKHKKFLNNVDNIDEIKSKYYFIVSIKRFFPIPTQMSILVFRTQCYEKENPENPIFIVRSVIPFDTDMRGGFIHGLPANVGLGSSAYNLTDTLAWLIKTGKAKSPD